MSNYPYIGQLAPAVGGGLGGLPRRKELVAQVANAYEPSFADVLLLMHCEGANGGVSFVDSSSFARTLTPTAFETSSAQTKFGSTSAHNTATTAKISVAASSDFAFGTGDFTVEAWIFQTSTGAGKYIASSQTNAGGGGFILNVSTTDALNAYVNNANLVSAAGIVTPNEWHHVALSRMNGLAVLAFDGEIVASASAVAENITSNAVYVGGRSDGLVYFNGYIDEVRVTKNDGIYAKYLKPSAAFPDK